MRSSLFKGALGVLICSLVGCSPSDDGRDPEVGAAGSPGAGAAGEAGSSNQGPYGEIRFSHVHDEPARLTLNASFFRDGPPDIAGLCSSVETYGSCLVRRCASGDPDLSSVPDTLPSAGLITVSSPPGNLVLSLQPDPTYAVYGSANGSLEANFSGGEVITFSATGAEVPVFSRAVDMPLPIVLEAPAATTQLIPVSRRGVDLRWVPGEAEVELVVVARIGGNEWSDIACTFDAGLGAGTIPAEALADFPDGEHLNPWTRRTVWHSAGTFELLLRVSTTVRTADDPRPRVLVLSDAL